jgi:hypothetical protein
MPLTLKKKCFVLLCKLYLHSLYYKKMYVLLDFFSIERIDNSPRGLDLENRAGVPVIRTLDPELFSWQCVISVQVH